MAVIANLVNSDVYTEHFFYKYRLKSFARAWPHYRSVNLSPQKMARAGFFFDPDDIDVDAVSCPFCLKILTGWERSDDPLMEHAKRKDVCYFARLSKDEKEWTVEDFLRLLAQRHISLMSSVTRKAVDGARDAMESVKRRIGVLAEKKRRKKTLKKKRKK